jgi:hypothetical protein
MTVRRRLLDELRQYKPADETEERHHRALLGHLAHASSPLSRSKFRPGHVTASLFIVDPATKRLLLHHHRLCAKAGRNRASRTWSSCPTTSRPDANAGRGRRERGRIQGIGLGGLRPRGRAHERRGVLPHDQEDTGAARLKPRNWNEEMTTSASGYDLTPLSAKERARLAGGLSPEERKILLHQGTEAPFCGTLLNNKGDGTYACRLCGLRQPLLPEFRLAPVPARLKAETALAKRRAALQSVVSQLLGSPRGPHHAMLGENLVHLRNVRCCARFYSRYRSGKG